MPAAPHHPSLATDGAFDAIALPAGPARDALHEAMQTLDLVRARPHPLILCEALTDVARHLAGQHAYTDAEAYLQQALRHAAQLPQAEDIRADLMCALAEVACNQADLIEAQADDSRDGQRRQRRARRAARTWAHRAAATARRTSDPQWEVSLLLRASDVLSRGGDRDDADAMQREAQAVLDGTGSGRRRAGTLLCVAPQALM